MRKIWNGTSFLSLSICAVLAAELFLILDGIVVYGGGMLPLYSPVFMVPVAALLFFLYFRGNWKKVLAFTVAVPVLLCAIAGLGYLSWKSFSADAGYENRDAGKHRIYGDRNVMVIVPHQDDELNILSGVMEEYIRYGSELRVVFVTNGDYVVSAETRQREAMAVCSSIGISEENVIFMGYGNEWAVGSPHIYNGEVNRVYESHIGKNATYGSEQYPAYREGRSYTREHLEEDMKDIILEYRPDVIFCSDYDHHIDHRATSLLFEKVMGRILKEEMSYRPVVYKGYAYGTAWEAEPDFYADNIMSTKNPFAEPYSQKPVVYRWEDRIRFPVAGEVLSRSLVGSLGYQRLAMHDSQGAGGFAAAVINGDKVFWQRPATSMTLQADITVSSGNAALLQDFMLVDSDDLVDSGHSPYDGVWTPEPEDTVRTATVALKEVSDVSEIVLYDHPSDLHNVRNAAIVFDDGTCVETGALDSGGAATHIPVDKKNVSGFSVSLLETEGDMSGLSEIEAFKNQYEKDGSFIKLMDMEGDFAYDYRTDSDGCVEFLLYTHGALPGLTEQDYSVETNMEKGNAEIDGAVIRVVCPAGAEMVLNVTCNSADVSDSIVVRNPGIVERIWMDFWEAVEQDFYFRFIGNENGVVSRLNVYRIWERVSYIIRHL